MAYELDPTDEYPHEPEEASNYNESMYFNAFDHAQEMGGWFRIGNRVNEGYAEVSCCIYLPDGRVGFNFKRPEISTNDEMRAGGMHFEVVTPFEELKVGYDGKVCLLDEPAQMSNPRQAFTENPMVPCTVELTYTGASPMYGGRPVRNDDLPPEEQFGRAHYEQHVRAHGTIRVGDDAWEIDGLGLRDKSWGPRFWQAINWYRWLPINFDDDFAMALSTICRTDDTTTGGVVYKDGTIERVREIEIDTEWDDDFHQRALDVVVTTDNRSYQVRGEVESLIPLRNRRRTPDGEMLMTRITEAMTRYQCDDRAGWGMSEYLDQIVDGRPVGLT